MRLERATAHLATRSEHAPAVAGQHPDGGPIRGPVPLVLDASGNEGHGSFRRSLRLRRPCHAAAGPAPGHQRAYALAEEWAREWREPPSERQHPSPPEDDAQAEPPHEPGPAGAQRLDLHPGPLHHPAEGDVRRADVLAGPALQTQVHEPGERRIDVRPAIGHGPHGGDPPPRRCRLLTGQPVGRAVWKAQPTGHAGGQVVVGGGIARPPVRRQAHRADEPGPLGHDGSQGRLDPLARVRHLRSLPRTARAPGHPPDRRTPSSDGERPGPGGRRSPALPDP